MTLSGVSACNWKEIQNLEVIAKVVVVLVLRVYRSGRSICFALAIGSVLFEEQ